MQISKPKRLCQMTAMSCSLLAQPELQRVCVEHIKVCEPESNPPIPRTVHIWMDIVLTWTILYYDFKFQ